MNEERMEQEEQTTVQEQKAPDAEAVQEQPEELTAEQKLQAELEELNNRYLRTLAEYDNFRKRSQKEKEAIYPEAKAAAIAAVLPVLDNFERAMSTPCSDEEFKKGMDMIKKAFDEMLAKQGIEEFGAAGEVFDPNLHNAVAHQEDDSVGENCISEVFQKGYRMGDRVLRYAMVKVAN